MTKRDVSSDRVVVVANERKLDPDTAAAVRSALAEQGFDVGWVAIHRGSAATKAVRRAVADGANRIVVAGGDGTVRAAVQALAGSRVPLSVIPAGTANVFATSLGLPTDPVELAAAMRAGSTRRLDTARCNGLAFALMAGTGLDAALIDSADDTSERVDKERFGTLAYVRAGVREARRREPFAAKVVVDGQRLFDGEATCVLVANVGRIMGGLQAFPASRPDDGVLDVAVITATGWREWGSLLVHAVRHQQTTSGHVHLARASKISVRMATKHRFELDGGTKGTARRLDIRVVPSSLTVVVPVAMAADAAPTVPGGEGRAVDAAETTAVPAPAPVSLDPASLDPASLDPVPSA